jgi:hypothetical protein
MEANVLPMHLRNDAPYQTCLLCGRKTWAQGEFGQVCNMRQPDGGICKGTFSARAENYETRIEELGDAIVGHVSAISAEEFERRNEAADKLIEKVSIREGIKVPLSLTKTPEVWMTDNIVHIRGVSIDLVKTRDTLLALRDGVFCPFCRCPNWMYEEGQRVDHYRPCELGDLTEIFLKLVPKNHTRMFWKS